MDTIGFITETLPGGEDYGVETICVEAACRISPLLLTPTFHISSPLPDGLVLAIGQDFARRYPLEWQRENEYYRVLAIDALGYECERLL